MFFRRLGLIKQKNPTILMNQPNEDGIEYTDMIQLPNGLLLSGSVMSFDGYKIHLELYDPINNTKIVHRLLNAAGNPNFLCVSNKWILIKGDNDLIYVVNTSNLESNIPLESKINALNLEFDHWVYLGEEKFATLSRVGNRKYRIMIHDLLNMTFNQSSSSLIIIPKETLVKSFTALSNDLLVCHVAGDNFNSDFEIDIFKNECGASINFEHIDTLYPMRTMGCRHVAEGHVVVLPDGKVLTYHFLGNFQIWEPESKEYEKCVAAWNFEDMIYNDKAFSNAYRVAPFPDGEHLLVLSRGLMTSKLFLLNMQTRMVKPVDLGKLEPLDINVSSNGLVAVICTNKHYKDKRLLCLDFKEMKDYRDGIKDKLLSAKLYSDVNNIITSYIFDKIPSKTKLIKKL